MSVSYVCMRRNSVIARKNALRYILLSLDLEGTDELSTLQASLEGDIFDSSLLVKKLLFGRQISLIIVRLTLPPHLLMVRESKYPNAMCQLSMATFSTGGPSGNSFSCLYTTVPTFLILKGSFTCNNLSRMDLPRVPLKDYRVLGNTTLNLSSV